MIDFILQRPLHLKLPVALLGDLAVPGIHGVHVGIKLNNDLPAVNISNLEALDLAIAATTPVVPCGCLQDTRFRINVLKLANKSQFFTLQSAAKVAATAVARMARRARRNIFFREAKVFAASMEDTLLKVA